MQTSLSLRFTRISARIAASQYDFAYRAPPLARQTDAENIFLQRLAWDRELTVASESTSVCVPGHCTDGIQNSGETDVDCGGECGECDACDPHCIVQFP